MKRKQKKNLLPGAKAYTPLHTGRRTVFLSVIFALGLLYMVLSYTVWADPLNPADIEKMKAEFISEDVATLPEGAVLGNPEFKEEWTVSFEPWCDGDNKKVLFYDLDDGNFNTVAQAQEGKEISKMQECIVSEIDGDKIICTAKDGCVYSVVNKYGLQLSDMAAIYFLLCA